MPVDPTRPDARRAAAIAQGVVPGRVLEVAREIELAPRSLTLLRLDYD